MSNKILIILLICYTFNCKNKIRREKKAALIPQSQFGHQDQDRRSAVDLQPWNHKLLNQQLDFTDIDYSTPFSLNYNYEEDEKNEKGCPKKNDTLSYSLDKKVDQLKYPIYSKNPKPYYNPLENSHQLQIDPNNPFKVDVYKRMIPINLVQNVIQAKLRNQTQFDYLKQSRRNYYNPYSQDNLENDKTILDSNLLHQKLKSYQEGQQAKYLDDENNPLNVQDTLEFVQEIKLKKQPNLQLFSISKIGKLKNKNKKI